MQAFKVFLNGKHIDTIFYSDSPKVTRDEVYRSLVNHDGYDTSIIVKKERKEPNPMTNQVNDLKFDVPFTPRPDTDGQKQARQFLADTRTTFKAKHIEYAPYFDDDKESRDIYRITLKRMGRSYTFRFGQSLNKTADGIEPTPYDVLACVTKNDPGTFEDFCSEYGCDTDSRKAEKMYHAVVKEWKGIDRLFGDVLDKLQEIA